MRTLWLVVVVVLGSGCAATFLATPAGVTPGGQATDQRCIDRLLSKSRSTGYVEHTVDKDTGFFRVLTKVNKRSIKNPVEWFNVECDANGFGLVTPVASKGVLGPKGRIHKLQRQELDDYAASLNGF